MKSEKAKPSGSVVLLQCFDQFEIID